MRFAHKMLPVGMNLRRAWPLVKVAVSVLLLTVLISRLGTDAVLRTVREASLWLPVAAVIALTVQTSLSALKWFLLLREQGVPIGYASLLKTYLISSFINLFMPSVAGGDAYRAVRVSGHTNGILRALPSIILDRVTGVAALVAVGVTGLTVLVAPDRLALVIVAMVVTLLAIYALVRGPVHKICSRLEPKSWFGLARLANLLVTALAPSVTLLWVIGISLVFQLNTVLINWIYTLLIGIDVPFTALLVIVPIVYLAEAVPISINGLGVREAAYAAMFVELGLPAEQGLLLGLTVSVMRYVAGTVGGAMLAVEAIRPPGDVKDRPPPPPVADRR